MMPYLFRRLFESLILVFLLLTVAPTPLVYAQLDDSEIELDELDDSIDSEFDLDDEEKDDSRPEFGLKELKDISDLATLAPFKDVAVIQRRFFDKTGRFEAYLAGTMVMNDAFFLNGGGAFRLGYFFSENWGIEGSVVGLLNGERSVIDSLGERGVVTSSIVTPKMYYGLDIKWFPIYGKMAFRDQRIIPYDLYFSLGGGLTQTNQSGAGGSAPTIHIGSGQNFAINKSWAFRWDFSWNFYTPSDDGSGVGSTGTFNNLFLTLGFSYYFPETAYR